MSDLIDTIFVQCCMSSAHGQQFMTVTLKSGLKFPKGFPRGELLSIGSNGDKNYSVCNKKLYCWLFDLKFKGV